MQGFLNEKVQVSYFPSDDRISYPLDMIHQRNVAAYPHDAETEKSLQDAVPINYDLLLVERSMNPVQKFLTFICQKYFKNFNFVAHNLGRHVHICLFCTLHGSNIICL